MNDSSNALTALLTPEIPANIRVAVLRDGQIEKLPGTDRRASPVGSVTKLFAAAILADLAAKAGVPLDRRVTDLLDGLPDDFPAVTLGQLLTHSAGLRDWLPSETDGRFDRSAFFTEPGRIFSYANPGYELIGRVIERLGGRTFANELLLRVVGPSRMRDAAFREADGPAGGLVATTADLARGARWLMESPERLALMSQATVDVPSRRGQRAGAGCFIHEREGLTFFEHTGAVDDTTALLRFAPSIGFAVAVLADGETAAESVADVIVENYLGMVPPTPPAFRLRKLEAHEFGRFVGTFENRPRRVEMFASGQLFLKRGGSAIPVVWNGDDRLALAVPLRRRSPDIAVVFNETSRAEYLYPLGSLRALRRVDAVGDGTF